MPKEIKTKELKAVEVFAAGKWNGDNYTNKDLDDMEAAFNETSDHFKPFIKIGHNKEQKLLAADELPAAGYVSNLYRNGDKLLADFIDIPDKIYTLLKSKAYSKRSAEIYWDLEFNGKTYPRFFSALSFLGSVMPAVSTLDDIINFYGLNPEKTARFEAKGSDNLKVCDIIHKEGKKEMPKEIKELEGEIVKLNAKNDAAAKKFSKTEGELKAEKEQKQKLEKELADIRAEKADNEMKAFCKDLITEKLATPGMQPLIETLLGPEQKEYCIVKSVKKEGEEEEKTEKKYSSKQELVKDILKLHSEASKVNFEENSDEVEPEVGKSEEDKQEEKIEAYMKEHDVKDYTLAYKAVMAEENQENED